MSRPSSLPTNLRFKLFKNPNTIEVIGKGGRELNPVPLGQAIGAVADRGRADDDDMYGRFGAGHGA